MIKRQMYGRASFDLLQTGHPCRLRGGRIRALLGYLILAAPLRLAAAYDRASLAFMLAALVLFG
jgi:hypothetical protein